MSNSFPARKRATMFALAASISLAAAACSSSDDDSSTLTTEEASEKTVAALLGGDDRFSAISEVLTDTGVASAFDGAGAYTVLAPENDALGALSGGDDAVAGQERRVLLIALLRQHILPGEVTPTSIREAVEASGGSVEMRNLAGGLVTFSLDGDAIVIGGEGDASTRIAGDTMVGSNGAVIPVEGPLASLSESE